MSLDREHRTSNRAGVDWEDLRRRIDTACDAVERAFDTDAAARRGILQARAKALAQVPADRDRTEDHIEIVEFVLGSERYAVESHRVREVFPLRELTELPGVPRCIRGIANVRGRILSVIDLKRAFGLAETELAPSVKLVIVSDATLEVGLIADAIVGVSSISTDRIQPPLPTLTDSRAKCLRGITNDGVAILDVSALLADERWFVQENFQG